MPEIKQDIKIIRFQDYKKTDKNKVDRSLLEVFIKGWEMAIVEHRIRTKP